jgi:hypothetical protein
MKTTDNYPGVFMPDPEVIFYCLPAVHKTINTQDFYGEFQDFMQFYRGQALSPTRF